MKAATLFIVLCFALFAFADDDSYCRPDTKCRGKEDTVTCGEGQICVNIGGNLEPSYVCLCQREYDVTCEPTYGCANKTDDSCGDLFPSGCPDETTCITDLKGNQRCVCEDTRFFYDPETKSCRVKCPQDSTFNIKEKKCVCNEGFVPERNSDEDAIKVYCVREVPTDSTTCKNITCRTGYLCEIRNELAVCVPDENASTCKTDFRCPESDLFHFVCLDTEYGPKCICERGWTGQFCNLRRCVSFETGEIGCPFQNSACVSDRLNEESVCRCDDGWTGEKCEIQMEKCKNVTCPENSRCYFGACRCAEGYMADRPSGEAECVPVRETGCPECDGNFVCVESNQEAKCICPYEAFGSRECNKPRCLRSEDCGENSICVRSTKDDVATFCICKPGFRGTFCNITTECKCESSRTCNNEGRCVCRPEFTGEKCDQTRPSSECREFDIYIDISEQRFDLEEIKRRLSLIADIDLSTISIDGPIDTRRENVKLYKVKFCGNENVDSEKSEEVFKNAVEQGDFEGLALVSAPDDSTTGSAASIVSSLLIMISMIAFSI